MTPSLSVMRSHARARPTSLLIIDNFLICVDTLRCDTLPTNGKLNIRELDERDKERIDNRQSDLPSTNDNTPF